MSLASRALALVAPPFCWGCGRDTRRPEPLCAGCRLELPWLGREPACLAGVTVWSPLAYEGPARALVRALKYRGAAGLARPMAAQLAAGAPAGLLSAPAALVPVPLHPRRRRRRGYNQAERLAAELSARTGLDVVDCLRRSGPATRQVGRGRAERIEGVGGSIGLAPAAAVPPAVVLVDDVATTGATLAACAAPLRRVGVKRLSAVVYARTPGR